MRHYFLSGWVVICLFNATLCLSGKTSLPFLPGEKLEYSLKWGFIPVGFATMEVSSRKHGDEEPWHIRFSVRTNKFADKFYKVRTDITSLVDANFTRSLEYMKSQQEGKTKKEIVVQFDYDDEKVVYKENKKTAQLLPLNRNVYDPLSIAFAFRFHPSTLQKEKIFPTCDGKKFLDVRLNIGKKSKVDVPFGSFWATDIVPDMKNLSGVFKKSPKGILRVWYSADNRRIPLKISSKVIVGSFTAQLLTARGLQKKGS